MATIYDQDPMPRELPPNARQFGSPRPIPEALPGQGAMGPGGNDLMQRFLHFRRLFGGQGSAAPPPGGGFGGGSGGFLGGFGSGPQIPGMLGRFLGQGLGQRRMG